MNASNPTITINKNIYGHFAEHLGRCIYGGLYVGENNERILHTRGIRKDVVEALRKIKIPVLRWPGGCFADTYRWKNAVGPKQNRPAMVNTWWGGATEDNSFGTHEFLDLCEQLGAEPFISGNTGSGTIEELAEWVQYVNFGGDSPMSDLRKKNGREKPWNVKYWGLGNEPWGCGGNMRAGYYVDLYRRYVTFMTGTWDTQLFRIAAGAGSADYQWTETVMKGIPLPLLGGLGMHHYSVISWEKKGRATEFSEQDYFSTLKSAWEMEEIVKVNSGIMDKYDPKRKVALVVDEWGGWYDSEPGASLYCRQNTMRDAMIAGVTLNIFNNHADRVRMANLAQTVNVLQAVILTDEERIIFTPTYHVMEMYSVHQDAQLLPVNVQSNLYKVGDGSLPSISVSASTDKHGKVHLSLVNVDARNPQDIVIEFNGAEFSSISGRILVSENIQDYNTFDLVNKIKPERFSEFSREGNTLNLKLPPCSVVVLGLQ